MVEVSPPQDLTMAHAEPHPPQWRHIKPLAITPIPADARKPTQRVRVFNSSPDQTHIIRDRHEQGHELKPQERREIDLRIDSIAYFLREREPNRRTNDGELKKLHPIVIEGIDEDGIKKAVSDYEAEEGKRAELMARQAARAELVDIFRDAGLTLPQAGGQASGERRSR